MSDAEVVRAVFTDARCQHVVTQGIQRWVVHAPTGVRDGRGRQVTDVLAQSYCSSDEAWSLAASELRGTQHAIMRAVGRET